MNLSNLTQEQLKKLKAIASKMNTTLEDLLRDHNDVNTLIESYNDQEFGMLNEYGQENSQILND